MWTADANAQRSDDLRFHGIREHRHVAAARGARAERLLCVPAGDNTLRLLPPLNCTDDEIAGAADRLEAACRAVEAGAERKSA